MLCQLDLFKKPLTAIPQPSHNALLAEKPKPIVTADGYDWTDMREIPNTHKEWYEHRNGLKVRNLRMKPDTVKKWHFEVTNGAFSILLEYEQWPTMYTPVARDAPPIFAELEKTP